MNIYIYIYIYICIHICIYISVDSRFRCSACREETGHFPRLFSSLLLPLLLIFCLALLATATASFSAGAVLSVSLLVPGGVVVSVTDYLPPSPPPPLHMHFSASVLAHRTQNTYIWMYIYIFQSTHASAVQPAVLMSGELQLHCQWTFLF